MVGCSIVYSYYENAEMLKVQQSEWEKYPDDVEIIIVDDCSQKFPLKSVLRPNKRVKVYKLNTKLPFNFLACRNVGYYNASGHWVLNLDIDHVIRSNDLQHLIIAIPILSERKIYLFRRIDVGSNTEIGSHGFCNFMTRQLFWNMGGYNERFSVKYHGVSGVHHSRFQQHAGEYIVLNIPLYLYDNSVVKDAVNMDFNRGESISKEDRIFRRKANKLPILNLSFDYERIK